MPFLKKDRPFYQYRFMFKGRRYRGTTGTTSKKEAELIEAQERLRVRNAYYFRDGEKPTLSLNEGAVRYATEIDVDHTALYQLENLVRLIGDIPLHTVDDAVMASFVAERRGERHRSYKDPRKAPLVTPATVNREVELLRRVSNRAVKTWKVQGADVDWGGHLRPEPDERVRSLTDEDECRLFELLREDYTPMISIAILSGLRLSNVLRLTWQQVDLIEGVINLKVKSKKEGGKNHVVPLTPQMSAIIANEKGHNPIHVFTYLCRRGRTQGKIVRRDGERYPFSIQGWKTHWRTVLREADITDFRFHDLRHTFATRLLRATGNLKLVQVAMAHESVSTTAKYAHVDTADIRAGMLKVPPSGHPDPAPIGKPVNKSRG